MKKIFKIMKKIFKKDIKSKSEYHHVDKKEYLIADGKRWKVWNNGIVEYLSREQNSDQTWEERLKFLKCWEKAEITQIYDFNWGIPKMFLSVDNDDLSTTFLGFKQPEQCPECKQSNLIWEGKIQLCKGCDYIHAFEYDDS